MSPADAVPYIDLEKAKYPEIDKLPFNSKNKFMATINEVDGERVLFIVRSGSARDVRRYSAIPAEDELLMPCV